MGHPRQKPRASVLSWNEETWSEGRRSRARAVGPALSWFLSGEPCDSGSIEGLLEEEGEIL